MCAHATTMSPLAIAVLGVLHSTSAPDESLPTLRRISVGTIKGADTCKTLRVPTRGTPSYCGTCHRRLRSFLRPSFSGVRRQRARIGCAITWDYIAIRAKAFGGWPVDPNFSRRRSCPHNTLYMDAVGEVALIRATRSFCGKWQSISQRVTSLRRVQRMDRYCNLVRHWATT